MLKVSLWPRILITAVLVVGLLQSWPTPTAQAAVNCVLGSTPHQLITGSTTNVQFVLQNNASDIQWFLITAPSGSYQVISADAPGWTADIQGQYITFSGGNVSAGSTFNFSMQTQAGSDPEDFNIWNAQASDTPDSNNAEYCSTAGDTTTEIVEPAGLQLTGLDASDLGSRSIRISWDTDHPASSVVHYGATSSYGLTTTGPAGALHHVVTLTNLTPNATYHYSVFSDAGGGMSASSPDNTFLTANETTVKNEIAAATVVGGGKITTPTGKPTETTPPAIAWTSTVQGAYAAPPTITGTASDNDAIAKIEYSTDGGKNWSAVSNVSAKAVTTGTGKKKTTTSDARSISFSFVPVLIEDGNYMVMARATDPSGNQARTEAQTLVIDRLPPRLGATLVAIGGQLIQPDAAGRWQTVTNVDQSLVTNVVGGPTRLTVAATRDKTNRVSQTFTLRQDPGSGLWRGAMSFQSAGLYHLSAMAIDGAGNQTQTALPDTFVLPAARLQSRSGGGITGGSITLHYLQPRSRQWVVWDAASYGQQNPQTTGKDGAFGLLAPAGTYYVRAEAPGHRTVVTRQFKLDRPTPLTASISLATTPEINLGFAKFHLPWVSLERITFQADQTNSQTKTNPLIGRTMPEFSLPNTAGGTVSAVGLLGKPTVISVVSTWGPSSGEQVPILDKLSTNPDINVVPLVAGERLGRVQAYFARGGYTQSAVVDADATLSAKLGVPTLPTHYILDRRGRVKAVLTGVKTADQLLDAVASK